MSLAQPATGATTLDAVPWGRVALVGVVAGFTSGLFGVGGGIVIVPLLVLVAGFPHKLATGTSLTAIVPISISGIVGYASAGEVDWAAAGCVTTGALVGTVVGTRWLVRVSPSVLQIVFAAAMLLTAARMFVEDGDGGGRADLTVALALALTLLGSVSGLLAGLLGVGGGIIIVPVLTLAFGLPHVLAKGTSLAVIVPTAVLGTLRNRRSQLTAVGPAVVVGVAGIATAFAASQLALELEPAVSQALFAALLTAVAVRVAVTGVTGWRADRAAAAGGPDSAGDAATGQRSDRPAG
jgi:hypothetical protein